MKRNECIDALKFMLSSTLGIKKSEITAFAEHSIEPFNVKAEREKYYDNYADSFEADKNYWLEQYRIWQEDN